MQKVWVPQLQKVYDKGRVPRLQRGLCILIIALAQQIRPLPLALLARDARAQTDARRARRQGQPATSLRIL